METRGGMLIDDEGGQVLDVLFEFGVTVAVVSQQDDVSLASGKTRCAAPRTLVNKVVVERKEFAQSSLLKAITKC